MSLHTIRVRVLLGALVALLLIGCSPQQTAEPTVVVTPTRGGASLGTEGQTVLRVGTGDSGEGLKPHLDIIARFEAANPDIQVKLEPVVSDDYYAELRSQIAAGSPPDLLQIGDDAVPSFVESGSLAPLDPFIGSTDYPLDTSIYLPGVLAPGKWAGKQYLLPKDFSPLAVYYNKKIFDQFGVPYPKDGWTWADFLNTAKALTRDTNNDGKTDIWGVQLTGSWPTSFEYWSAAAGGQLVGSDGSGFIGYMDSPYNVEALQFYADLYHKYKVAPLPADLNPFNSANNEFERGAAAMRIFGRWPQASLRQNPNIALGVVGMPVGKRRANILLWGGFGIAALSKHPEEAWRFLRFYAGTEGAEVWKGWALPSVQSVAESSGMNTDPIEGVWIGELNHLVPRAYLSMPIWSRAGEPALRKLLEQAVTDDSLDPITALYDAAQESQGALVSQP